MPINLINQLKSTLDKKILDQTTDLTELEARTLLEFVRPIPEDVEPEIHQKKERTKDLSIIIPAQNEAKYIPKCLTSIFNEVKPLGIDYEIIVVESDSTDDTLDLLEEYGDEITLLSISNASLGAAKNAALDFASGRYIMFVDADDYVLPEAIADMWHAMEASDADILAHGYLDYADAGYHPVSDIPHFVYELNEMTHISPYLWGKMYKAELFNEVRCPQGLYYDNMLATYLLFPRAKSAYLMDGCGYVYHKHASMLSKTLIKTKACIDTVWTLEYCLDHMGDLFYKNPAAFYRKVLNHFTILSYARIRKMPADIREAVFVIGAATLEKLEAKMSQEDLEKLDVLMTSSEKVAQRIFRNRRVGVWEYVCQYGFDILAKREKEAYTKRQTSLLD